MFRFYCKGPVSNGGLRNPLVHPEADIRFPRTNKGAIDRWDSAIVRLNRNTYITNSDFRPF